MSGDNNDNRAARTDAALLDERREPAAHARDRGAGMVEYALLLVLVLLVAFLSVKFFGESVVGLFDGSAESFDSEPN